MYSPRHYITNDFEAAFNLMDRFPFAQLISVDPDNGSPIVSHLPMTPVMARDKIELIGHMAKGNTQWKTFGPRVTAVFLGPHAYITPKWYETNDVPTWNYSAVHVRGSVTVIEDPAGLKECLNTLTRHVERLWPSGWEFYIPDDLNQRLGQSIVGFRIAIDSLQFKQKFGQNKSPASVEGVMQGLRDRGDSRSVELAREMEAHYNK